MLAWFALSLIGAGDAASTTGGTSGTFASACVAWLAVGVFEIAGACATDDLTLLTCI